MLIFLIPIATAVNECQRTQQIKDIPCYVISTWNPGNCTDYNAIIYKNGSEVLNYTWQDLTPISYYQFNIKEKGTYYYNSSLEDGVIVVASDDDMVGLGVILFLLLLNIILFALPFYMRFTNDEVTNLIIKRSVWLVGLAVLAFVTTIIITLADNQGLGITKELFMFHWIFVNGIYIGMILLFFSFFVSVPKLWSEKKKKERMGEDE